MARGGRLAACITPAMPPWWGALWWVGDTYLCVCVCVCVCV